MTDTTDEQMPSEFDTVVERWRSADQDVRSTLSRYKAAPNVVNRLAVAMAWAAIVVPLAELGGWAELHPGSPAVVASAQAHASWEELHWKMQQAGLHAQMD